MKINGSIITGLYLFVRGIDYTKGDLLWYSENKTLYVVTGDYDGTVYPDLSDLCVDFFTYHEWSEDNNNDEAVITAKVFQLILNYYIKGLKGNREVEAVNIVDMSDFDTFLYTAVYFCTISETCICDIPAGNYLMHVYKVDNKIIQEFVDYVSGVMYYRYYVDEEYNGMSVIPTCDGGIDSEKWSNFISKLAALSIRFNNFYHKAKSALSETSFRFVEVPEKNSDALTSTGYYRIDGTNEYIVDGIGTDFILNVIFNYEKYDTIQQFNINAYITENLGVTHRLNDLDGQELTVTINHDAVNNRVNIFVSNFEMNITKMYIDNGKNPIS